MTRKLRVHGRYLLCLPAALACLALSAQSDGGFTSGAAAYCDTINSGFISLNNYKGSVLHWEQLTASQPGWQKIQNTTSAQSYNNLKQTTSFRAIVQDSVFPPDTSTVATITVHVPGVAGTLNGGGTFCADANAGSLTLSGTQGNVLFWQYMEAGGSWQTVNNTGFVLQYANLSTTRAYRAVVQLVQGCDADTTEIAYVNIDATSVGGKISGGDTLCFNTPGDTLWVTGEHGAVVSWLVSADEGKNWKIEQYGGAGFYYSTVLSTRWFAVVVKNGVCPEDTSGAVAVASFPEVTALAGPDVRITKRESVQLRGEGNGAARWRPALGLSDSTSFSPLASPPETTTYVLLVTDSNGCVGTDSVVVVVDIPIPSAITPNGDGMNDRFEIYEVEKLAGNALHIYNRWGQLVFEASPYKNEFDGHGRDGAALPEGTYYYTFDFGNGKKVTGYMLLTR